jgi:hypothetical protein
VVAFSKISMHLMNNIYADEVVKYEKSAKAQKLRDEIKARKDYQEYLTYYIDELASRSEALDMANFSDRLDKYA